MGFPARGDLWSELVPEGLLSLQPQLEADVLGGSGDGSAGLEAIRGLLSEFYPFKKDEEFDLAGQLADEQLSIAHGCS
ncbi:unnamed protein product [Symbiodinium natans]|uniref:Uncharacterized protein n=1 Tax=Symbiodinium natans TaxID=878477 RepID=A0A812RBD6_9DINO|nr:unnamed protein product [Symbiodinium natans]